MGKHSGKPSSRLLRCIRAPYRMLRRARDMYVSGMTSCAGRVQYGAAMGYPAFADLSRSCSVQSSRTSSSDEDLRELMRAASVARGGDRKMQAAAAAVAGESMPRSQSVAVGRIDEDRPCDFGMEDVSVGTDLLLPRSRSYAVGPRRARATRARARAFV